MAHGDYRCCAVCDSKVAYAQDVDSKDILCSRCACDLASEGFRIHNVEELREWMTTTSPEVVVTVLRGVRYKACCYPNEVDTLFQAVLAKCVGTI
jgi:hypothetical protein